MLTHWNNSPQICMSPHSDTLSRIFGFIAMCLAEKQQIPILWSLVWPDRGSNPRSTTLATSTTLGHQMILNTCHMHIECKESLGRIWKDQWLKQRIQKCAYYKEIQIVTTEHWFIGNISKQNTFKYCCSCTYQSLISKMTPTQININMLENTFN